ncbi:polysaccharide deacetylase family protein [Sorangium cellulosum]|uniref:polysaccharide deacetylase family protein n=1 Tax=Sorangium cellulosum TaxID=56 RepID=UPI001F447968|nr:polysaccharide deacetylase family protein [Sorangium cellulosum]
MLGALHFSGCSDDGGGGGSDGSGGQPTASGSGTSGSVTSGDPGGTTSTSATGGTGGSGTGTGGNDAAGGGGSDPVGPAVDSGLPTPPGAGDVAKPSGAPGGFKVIDWAGFAGAVSYSFDDSNSSQIQNYDALNALGVPFTFYLQTGKNESNDPVWQRALTDGHELGNHTKSHSSEDNGSDTDAATQFIEDKFGVRPWTMAAPNGSSVYTGIARTRFLINRGVSNALIAPNDNTDPFTLPSYIPPTGASASVMDEQVTSARTAKRWRTFCIHGFNGGSDGAYQPIALQAFVDHVEHVKDLGDVWIDSIVNIGAYWLGQKAVSSVTGTQAGGGTTWTWQLPANFPPGKYVRVTVTGGTLTQNGVALPWNPHGYYEVALDPKSVTLSP